MSKSKVGCLGMIKNNIYAILETYVICQPKFLSFYMSGSFLFLFYLHALNLV